MTPPLGRRQFLAATGTASAALAIAGGGTADAATAPSAATARARPFPLTAVTLLDSPFRDNQRRNSAYLHFVDIDRLLHTFRTNVGLPSTAQPCGGWEGPNVELRGHSTGHLLSGLALAHAGTGDTALRDKGRALVAELAACQAASPAAGFGKGYLSAFPESFFDRLEAARECGRRTTRSTRSWPDWSSSTDCPGTTRPSTSCSGRRDGSTRAPPD